MVRARLGLAGLTMAVMVSSAFGGEGRLLKADKPEDALTGKWIAIGDGQVWSQGQLKKAVTDIKQAYMLGVATGDDDSVAEARIQNVFVSFDCDEQCALQVAELEGVQVSQDMKVSVDGRRRRRRRRKGDDSNDDDGDAKAPKPSLPESWGINRIDQDKLPLSKKTFFTTSHTGKGVNVYIVDTGITPDHEEWAGRGELGQDFVFEADKKDGNGHGTHCAGSAVGNSYGVAREATVIGVKVLSRSGSGSTSGVVRGVEWAVENQKKKFKNQPAVISMSLGGGANIAMDKAVREAAAAGHIVVVAAGNQNSNACGYSPARAGGAASLSDQGVITVASTDSKDRRSSFSNWGTCVDIFAPGTSITSAWIGSDNKSTKTISGTSMAAPHVTGVAATLLEKHGMDKQSAQAELFAISAVNEISNVGTGSPNLLLQTPRYTGPPTPPTRSPTRPPTFEPVDFFITQGKKESITYAESTFAQIPEDKLISGPFAYADGANADGCDAPKSSADKKQWQGKIVIVERGNCLFYNKALYAEQRGAIGTVIALTSRGSPYPPAYYGDGKPVGIPAIMISLNDADALRDMVDDGSDVIGNLGSPSFLEENNDGNDPTPPTQSPTNAPGRRRRRRRRRRGRLLRDDTDQEQETIDDKQQPLDMGNGEM